MPHDGEICQLRDETIDVDLENLGRIMRHATSIQSGHASVPVRVVLTIASVAAIALSLTTGASAQAQTSTREIFTFSDPFSGSFDCPGFHGTFTGHDKGRVMTWFDADGDPIKQIGRIKSFETDANSSTGKSIFVRTNLTVHVDFAAGTTTLTGIRNLSTDRGKGVVVQHVGRVITDANGVQIFLSGKFPEFDPNYTSQDFCAALE